MRRWIILIVVLGLLFGGFVLADRTARNTARDRIAERIQRSQKLAERPEVTVAGWPFLTQALSGRYERIDAGMRNPAVSGGLTIDRLDVSLRGMRVKLAALAAGDVASVPVDHATATATIGFDALDEAARENLPNPKSSLTFGPGKKSDELRLTGSYRSPVLRADIDAGVRLLVRDGRLVVELEEGALDDVPEVLRPQVEQLILQASRPPRLPFGFRPASVDVAENGVTIRAEAASFRLSSASAAP